MYVHTFMYARVCVCVCVCVCVHVCVCMCVCACVCDISIILSFRNMRTWAQIFILPLCVHISVTSQYYLHML